MQAGEKVGGDNCTTDRGGRTMATILVSYYMLSLVEIINIALLKNGPVLKVFPKSGGWTMGLRQTVSLHTSLDK